MNEEEMKGENTEKMSGKEMTDHQAVADHDKKGKKIRFKKDDREEELQKKVDELNDKYLRLFAEFDNYRKRTMKEKSDLITYASEDMISSLLPVIDDFERASASFNTTTDIESLKSGMMLIINKMKGILEQKGLSPIESLGNPFNTDYHEAVTSISVGEDKKGTIVDEIQKGYSFKGKIIRFAKVVVGN